MPASTKLPPEAIEAWTGYEAPDVKHVGAELRESVLLRHAFMSGWLARNGDERVARGLKLLEDIDSGAVELWSEGSNRKEKR